MNVLFNCIFLVLITRNTIHCQPDLNKGNNEQNAEIYNKAKIDRRFLDDLDDYEWHVAHLRGAEFDGRRDCMDDTFADKVRRYRKMLKSDGSRVEFVSSDPIPVDPSEIVEESCKVEDEPQKYDMNIQKHSTTRHINVTDNNFNVPPTTVAPNITNIFNTTVSMKVEGTTPIVDHKATTVASKTKPLIPKKKSQNETMDMEKLRRASEYMFSSVEYYDESIEFDAAKLCPDAVEVITLEIDQIRGYDLECELTLEWRSLE